jgi:hypothetical protein
MAVAAVGLGTASTAVAAGENPLFTPVTGQSIAGTSGTSILYAGGHLVVCGKGVYTGAISTALLLGNAKAHYLSCVTLETPTSSERCEVNSVGASAGLILSKTLHGILGLILPSKRTGILFLPQSGKVFTELAANAATPETKVTGDIAGEYTPVGKSQKTATIVFVLSAGAASVKDFDLTHGLGLVKPEVVAFAEPAGLSQTEELATEANLEVT